MPTHLYIARADNGPVKIGVSDDVERRVATFQLCSPCRITIAATTEGGYMLERIIKRRLKPHVLWGEWFAPCDTVDEVVDLVASRGVDAFLPVNDLAIDAFRGTHWSAAKFGLTVGEMARWKSLGGVPDEKAPQVARFSMDAFERFSGRQRDKVQTHAARIAAIAAKGA